MRLDLRLLACALFLAPSVAATSPTTDYATAFPLDTHGTGDAFRIEATPVLYAHGKPDAYLRDMVVVNSLGVEVPLAPLAPAPAVAHPYQLHTRLLPVPGEASERDGTGHIRRSSDGSVQIDLGAGELAAKPPRHWIIDARRAISAERLTIDKVNGTDVQLELAVDASNDLQHWDERVSDVTVTSIARGDDAVDNRIIGLSGDPARYYRLRVVGGDVPWDVEHTPGVTVEGSFIDAGDQRMAAFQWVEVNGKADDNHGFVYELPATLPVGAVQVKLAEANGAARVQLSSRGVTDAWTPLGDVTATTVGGQGDGATIATTAGKSLPNTLRIDDTRLHALRLTSIPALQQPPTLRVAFTPDRFAFLAQGPGPYRVLVGSYAARRGDSPVDAALDKLRLDKGPDWQPPLATLGIPAVAAGEAALQPAKVPFDWTKPLLWGVLVLGALLVIGMAVSLLRSAKGEDKA
ncbi:DUF3999 family protein [Pinirhizobacter sp.]|jgi:hypothetical protein|uniref:DUF3999 family protein n=1 Tax=Pinirhizobacter sp. TaxID=2950432 RepID=UPI002F42854D